MPQSQSVPSRIDPGTPIQTPQTYFWVWVEAVRLSKSPSRLGAPLNSMTDMFPIINKYYKPKSGVKTPPNPSVYLSKMGTLGLLRKFEDGFWIPETEVVLRVNDKIVYTPSDLPALLSGKEERFQPPGSAVSQPSDGKTKGKRVRLTRKPEDRAANVAPSPATADAGASIHEDLSSMSEEELDAFSSHWTETLAHAQAQLERLEAERKHRRQVFVLKEQEAELARRRKKLDALQQELDALQQELDLRKKALGLI